MPEDVRVLHVDDDPDFLDVAGTAIERVDPRLTVVGETDPRRVLERLAAERVDCVVADYHMPELDGVGLLETVRASYPDLPFFLFTGKGSEAVASEAISAGVTDYVRKAHGEDSYQLLANRIHHAVASHRAHQRATALERLQRIRREVNEVLVRATEAATIHERVPAVVADVSPYVFAWFGTVDDATGTVDPVASAGNGDGYLDVVRVSSAADERTGQGPGGVALREDRVVVVSDVAGDERFEPWRDPALARGFRSVAAIPIRHGDTRYGLLAVYADRADAVDETERATLAELGDDVAHALYAHDMRRSLRAERDRRDALFSNNPSPVVRVRFEDGAAVVEEVNDAFERTFGFGAEDVVDEPVTDTIVPEDRREGHESIRQRVYDGERVEVRVERATADGRREFLLRVIPLDVTDHSSGCYAWFQDVTERAERRRQLERQRDRLSEFAHGVSHDLKSPLSALSTRLDVAESTGDEQQFERARQTVDRMDQIIEDVLALAQEREPVTDPEPVDLAAVVERCFQAIDASGATLRVSADVTVAADERRLRRLLTNCLTNAVDHAGEDVTVRVGALPAADGFFVADDGPGIPPADRDLVFDRGFSTSREGTGYGLSLVRRVATAHGWDVDVAESEAGGARIEVRGVDVVDGGTSVGGEAPSAGGDHASADGDRTATDAVRADDSSAERRRSPGSVPDSDERPDS